MNNEDRESATGEDNAEPSSSSVTIRKSHKNETTYDESEQPNQQKNTISDSQQKPINAIGTGKSYTGVGLKKTFHSFSFLMQLSMLYIARGLKRGCAFQVATEVEAAGKFDNLLFLHDKDEVGFFQAKYKLYKSKKLTEKHFLSDDGDFSIPKYFPSYNIILNDKQLEKVIKGRKLLFVLYTNIGIDENTLEKSFEPVTASSILALSTKEEQKYYYSIRKDSDLYVKLLKMTVPRKQVAEHLAIAVADYKKESIQINELLSSHRDWLLANVLEVGKEESKMGIRYFVTFRDSFLTGPEQNESNFQEIFYNKYLEQTKQTNPSSVQKKLSDVKFQVPKRFAWPTKSSAESVQDLSHTLATFLDKLVFAVKQPSEDELGDIIEKEISNMGYDDRKSIASKFKLYVQDWVTQKEGRFLKNEDVERQLAVWGYETVSQSRMKEIEKYNCAFEESNDVIVYLSNFLNIQTYKRTMHDVLYLYCSETLFSKIKVFQVIKTCSQENINQQFMFCDISDLIIFENTPKCPVKAFTSQTCSFLFVSLEDCQLKDAEVKILHRLLEVIVESNRIAERPLSKIKQQKRLITSIPYKIKSEFTEKILCYDQKIKCLHMDDLNNTFSKLDENSRQQLMEKGLIKVQGNCITGILSENELHLCMRDEVLLKFILNKLEINDIFVQSNQYNEEVQQYYINRYLLSAIVDQGITKDILFHLVRENTHKNIKNQEVVVVSSNKNLFNHFCKKYVNVHWVQETNNIFLWVTSQGNLTNISKYIAAQDPELDLDSGICSDSGVSEYSDDESDKDSNDDLDSDSDFDQDREPKNYITHITDVQNDVVLISANPGMGKSTLLSHIAEKSKKENKTSFFVFKTKLTSTIEKLDSLKNENDVTLEAAIHFVFIATQIESPKTEESESAFNLLTVQEDGSVVCSHNTDSDHLKVLRALLFCNFYNNEKIVLLLDGFDEIAPDYSEITLILLQTLKNKSRVRKMWVTTRPYGVRKDLEHYLETFAYTLKPLSRNMQIKFFENFWKHKIKTQPTKTTKSPVKDFLKSLNLETLSALHKTDRKQNPNKNILSFMGVPLHCYMLAKVLNKKFTEFHSQNTNREINNAPAITSITIYDLFSTFFDIKFDEILHDENLKNPKNLSHRKNKKIAESNHGKLALLQLFDKEQRVADLVSDDDRNSLIETVNCGNEKIGIVSEVIGNKPQFVHQTFAEYFAAHYLAEEMINSGENKRKKAARYLLYTSVTGSLEHYYVLFTFFNYIVASKSDKKEIFESAIAGNIQKLSKIENLNKILDPLKRTPMHLIAIDLCNGFRKFLNLHLRVDERTAITMSKYFRNFVQSLYQSMSEHSPDALFNWTPAHYFTMSLCAESSGMFLFLIRYLTDVTPDALHRTPLMVFFLRKPRIYNWIQASPLRWDGINAQDKFFKTALHYLLENCSNVVAIEHYENLLDSICFLLKHGARIDLSDKRGRKCQHIINSLFCKIPRDTFKKLLLIQKQKSMNCNTDDVYRIGSKHMTGHVEEYLCSFENYELQNMREIDPVEGQTEFEQRVHSDDTKHMLRYSLLHQLHNNYNTPIWPVPDSEVLTLLYIDELPPKITETLVKETDLHMLSSPNYDRENIVFLLTMTKTIAPILLSKFPHLVNVEDSRGRTALHYAVNNKNEPRVTLLIKSNACVNKPDNTDKMPAHVEKSNVLCDSNSFDKEKLNFIDTLSYEIASPLVLTMDLYPTRKQIDADFIVYVLYNTITIAHVLLSPKTDIENTTDIVNTQDSRGRTALHYAVETEDTRAVCYLINKNAQADIADHERKYPTQFDKELYLLSKKKEGISGYPAQNLKNKLSFINALPFEVAKPLVLTMDLVSNHEVLKCILNDYRTIASALWAEYSDLLKTNTVKDKCSYFNSSNVSNEIVCRLLEIYHIEDFSDNIVNLNEVLKLVVELFNSVRNDDLSRVQTVLKCLEPHNPIKYKSITRKWVFPDTLNFRGVYKNDKPFVLSTQSRDTFTAVSRDNLPNVIDEVNVATSVINARSKDGGKTALHYAAEKGNAEMVKALLSHGAYYNAPDYHGSSPLQIAEIHGNSDVLHLLDILEMLFNSLYKESYDSIAKLEDVEGRLFRCICFKTKKPLIYMVYEQKQQILFDSFVKCISI